MCLKDFLRPILFLLLLPGTLAQAQRRIAITFDDLPAHGPLPGTETRLSIAQSILKTLSQNQMPPTYGFINGVRTEEHPETMAVLQAWRAAGQPLGNHTWAHPSLGETPAFLFEAEIEANQPLLRQWMGAEDWHWFRYPYLQEGETVEKHREVRAWLQRNRYQIAEVTMDFEDYLWNAPYARCVAKQDTAAIAQLHDTYLATASHFIDYYHALSLAVYGRDPSYILLMHVGAFDAHMLPELLQLYRSRGFQFVSLPEAAADPIYARDPDVADTRGDGLTEMFATPRGIAMPPHTKPVQWLDTVCR